MLSPNKITALKIFIHTRLSGNHTDYINEEDRFKSNVFVEQVVSDTIRDQVLGIKETLGNKGYTINDLNEMHDGADSFYIYMYYKNMVDTYNKYTIMGKNEEDKIVIEGVVGLALLSLLYDEKNIVRDIDEDLIDILSKFENKDTSRRDVVFRMHKIASSIYDNLNKYKAKINTIHKSKKKRK